MKLKFVECPVCEGKGKHYNTECCGQGFDGPMFRDTVSPCICEGGKILKFDTPTQFFEGHPYEIFIAWQGEVKAITAGVSTGHDLGDYLLKNNKLDDFHKECTKAESDWEIGIRLTIARFESEDSNMLRKAKMWQQIVGNLLQQSWESNVVYTDGTVLVNKVHDGMDDYTRRFPLFMFHMPEVITDMLGLTHPVQTKENFDRRYRQTYEQLKTPVIPPIDTPHPDDPF